MGTNCLASSTFFSPRMQRKQPLNTESGFSIVLLIIFCIGPKPVSGVLNNSIWTRLSPALCCRWGRWRLFGGRGKSSHGKTEVRDSSHPTPMQLALRFPLPSLSQMRQLQLCEMVPVHCKACKCKPLPFRNLANCPPWSHIQ